MVLSVLLRRSSRWPRPSHAPCEAASQDPGVSQRSCAVLASVSPCTSDEIITVTLPQSAVNGTPSLAGYSGLSFAFGPHREPLGSADFTSHVPPAQHANVPPTIAPFSTIQ